MDNVDQNANPESDAARRPKPADFVMYVPWACKELQVHQQVIINKQIQSDYLSVSNQAKLKSKKMVRGSDIEMQTSLKDKSKLFEDIGNINSVNIIAIHHNENLVQIKFVNNKLIPRTLLKIIGIIIKLQIQLQAITINSGLDEYTVYEISKFLHLSNITDICLDGAIANEERNYNYQLLLDNSTQLRHLSLSRCNIDDDLAEKIASKLSHPLPASKTLALLNLSSNVITDAGAKHFAEALRSNRKLNYLNLADNTLTDGGAETILCSLSQFMLSPNEIIAVRTRNVTYLKELLSTVERTAAELRDVNTEKRLAVNRKRNTKPIQIEKARKGKELLKEVSVSARSMTNSATSNYKKAEDLAFNLMGEFNDPHSNDHVYRKDDSLYCKGNFVLCYLNLSYNNLTYHTLKKLVAVLEYQQRLEGKAVVCPKGLITVILEGNPLPATCEELVNIEQMLRSRKDSIQLMKRRTTLHRKT